MIVSSKAAVCAAVPEIDNMSTVVAIDGPAGAGKSTVARLLAERMGYAYVNTGSLYRALAYAALRSGVEPGALTVEFLQQQKLQFRGADLYLNGVKLDAVLVSCCLGLKSDNALVEQYLVEHGTQHIAVSGIAHSHLHCFGERAA